MQTGFRQKVCVFFLLIVALIIAPGVGYTQESYEKLKVCSQLFTPHLLSEEQLRFAAERFDAITIGQWKESLVKASILKYYNPNVLIFGYVNSSHLIIDSWRYKECQSDEQLFAHDANGNRVRHTVFNSMLMDVQNPEWTEKVVKWVQELPSDMDGVLLDDAAPTLYEPFYKALPAQYDPENHASAMMGLLQEVKGSTSMFVIFNGIKDGLKRDGYVNDVDGGALEGFIYSRDNQGTVVNKVYNHVNTLIKAAKKNMLVSATVQSYKGEVQKREFALGCYLLAASEYSTYSFDDITDQNFSSVQYYPEYELRLGNPLIQPQEINNLYDPKTRLYVRHYENGMVLLNPWEGNIRVSVPKGHYRVKLNGGGSVGPDGTFNGFLSYRRLSRKMTVPAQSAIILVKRP